MRTTSSFCLLPSRSFPSSLSSTSGATVSEGEGREGKGGIEEREGREEEMEEEGGREGG